MPACHPQMLVPTELACDAIIVSHAYPWQAAAAVSLPYCCTLCGCLPSHSLFTTLSDSSGKQRGGSLLTLLQLVRLSCFLFAFPLRGKLLHSYPSHQHLLVCLLFPTVSHGQGSTGGCSGGAQAAPRLLWSAGQPPPAQPAAVGAPHQQEHCRWEGRVTGQGGGHTRDETVCGVKRAGTTEFIQYLAQCSSQYERD